MKFRFTFILLLLVIIGLAGCQCSKKVAEPESAVKKKETTEEGEIVEQLKEFTGAEYVDPAGKIAIMETSMGTIKLEFYPDVAQNTVQSFIHLANKGFYDGLTFHRVIDGFVIQGGCPLGTGTGGPGYRIKAEFNKRKHTLGALSMARSDDPDSAGSQFFICLGDLVRLDDKYTVFGGTIEGVEVVQAIGKVETGAMDKPVTAVVMKSVKIVDKE